MAKPSPVLKAEQQPLLFSEAEVIRTEKADSFEDSDPDNNGGDGDNDSGLKGEPSQVEPLLQDIESVESIGVDPYRDHAVYQCPSCRSLLDAIESSCQGCGFSITIADERFSSGDGDLRVNLINDEVHCLRLSERQDIEARLETFAEQCAPYFLSVYIDAGLQDISMTEMGFWLLNRARFFRSETRVDAVDNASGILLLMDVRSGLATLSMGYRVERAIEHKLLQRALQTASRSWRLGQYYKGFAKLISSIEKEFNKYGKRQLEGQRR